MDVEKGFVLVYSSSSGLKHTRDWWKVISNSIQQVDPRE